MAAPHLKARRLLRKAWQYAVSYYPSRRASHLFADIRTFCMFIGYPRSGHTLVGSLIDAHPYAVVSNELNIIGHVKRGFSREQIYTLILANARAFARSGSMWNGYTYAVPHQWQGRFEQLQVIGDKRGAGTVRQLRTHPALLRRLQDTIGADLRFVHVVRNPFDNIGTIVRRHRWPMPKAVEYYFMLCRTISDLKQQAPAGAVLDVFHERLITRPAEELAAICTFLGLEPLRGYLEDCASIVFTAPKKTRFELAWPSEIRSAVDAQAAAFPWLQQYSYDT